MIRVFYWQASAGSLTCWGGVPVVCRVTRSGVSLGPLMEDCGAGGWWEMSQHTISVQRGFLQWSWTPLALLGWTIHLWGGCLVELCVPLGTDNAALLGVPVPAWVCWWVLYFPGMLCFWRFLLSFSATPDREGIETLWCSSPLHPRWGPVSPRSLEGPIRVSACVERCPGMFLFLLCLLCLAWYHLK